MDATVTPIRPHEAVPRRDCIPAVATFFASLGWEPMDMFLVDGMSPMVAAEIATAMTALEAVRR